MFFRFLAALIACLGIALTPASAGIFGDAPDAILCPMKGTGGMPNAVVVFYIDAQGDNGALLYRTLGVTPVQFIVDPEGVVESGNIAECSGKTLRELRDAGRTIDY